MKPWLLRLPFVMLVAASMGWLGMILMFTGSGYLPPFQDFWTRYVVLASVVIWVPASALLRSRSFRARAIFGAASPLLGSLPVAPPASIAFVIARAYIAIPVGLTTGLILHWIFRTGARPEISGSPVAVVAAAVDR
jgi:hypothetical protein